MSSCETTEINEFAMQASIDGELYQSTSAKGTVDEDGSLTIEGSAHIQSIFLNLASFEEGDHEIGPNMQNSAIYIGANGSRYITDPNEPGKVTISKINMANNTLEGTFYFRAVQPGIDTVYVSKGFLYNVPYGSPTGIPTNDGSLVAKVDNEDFLAMSVGANDDGEEIVINGITPSATISLTVPNTVDVGDYILPQGGFSAEYIDTDGPQTATEGTITIIEHDLSTKTLKGSFFFSTDLRVITEGEFEVVYR